MTLKNYGYAGLFLLALTAYFFAGRMGILAHQDPGEMDTAAYLEASLDVHRTGGVLQHIPNCLSGVYKQATQHPLYLLVLSPKAERNARFFVRAKFITYGIGFVFLSFLFLALWKILNVQTAILGLCLSLFSATFIHMTTMVACESLLALFFVLFWMFTLLGFKKNAFWPAAGAAASLTFLTKSIGILLLPAFFLSVVYFYRKDLKSILLNKYFWGFFAVFFIIASPLLIRNYKVYGTPLYSDSKAVLWIDKWNDYNSPEEIKKEFTPQNYLKTHPPAQVFKIFMQGLYVRDVQMLEDGLKPLPFWNRTMKLKVLQGYHEETVKWQGIWAFFLYVLFLAGIWMRRREPDALLTLLLTGIFFVFVGWFSKIFSGVPPTRLLYPIFFLIIGYAAFAVTKILPREKVLMAVALIFLSVYLFCVASREDVRAKDLSKSYAFNKIFAAQIIWVRDQLKSGDRLLAGNTFMANLFYFKDGIKADVMQWPSVNTLRDAEVFVRDQRVNYAILDLSTVLYNYAAFGEYFNVGPKIGLRPKKTLPPLFKPIPRDPRVPPLYELYSF